MKLAAVLMAVLVTGAFGCKDDPIESFDNYQDCFDDHAEKEMLPIEEAIVSCCLEHPIDGKTEVCGDTKADCINYLTINLDQTSADPGQVMDACGEYVTEKNMPTN